MKTLPDFEKLKLSDYGMIRASYVSCQGRRERDMHKVYEHAKTCPFCHAWMKNQEAMDKRLVPSNADRQRVIDKWKKEEKMLVKTQAVA